MGTCEEREQLASRGDAAAAGIGRMLPTALLTGTPLTRTGATGCPRGTSLRFHNNLYDVDIVIPIFCK